MGRLSPSSSRSSLQVLTPTAYMEDDAPAHALWRSRDDPRTSSTQSLVPSLDEAGAGAGGRRTLLVVYVHGFMGNDSSFRSFPAHVHGFLRAALAETHVVHSKIYPRYKTYKAIEVARDNFGDWLAPHEHADTDVVLVGHSMGGLLAAEVVLMPQEDPQVDYPFQHRILGTISLDSPFLGLHPGIVVSGIASLFRKAPEPKPDVPGASQSMDGLTLNQNVSGSISPDPSLYNEMTSLSGVQSPASSSVLSPTTTNNNTAASSSSSSQTQAQSSSDPYFNPAFFNDRLLQDRGWFSNMVHFAKKHQPEGIVSAARQHIVNHLEFGACLADYVGMNQRYTRLRRLEDVDDFATAAAGGSSGRRADVARVRFVNYYTLSTGRIKKDDKDKDKGKSRRPSPGAGAGSRPRAGTHLKPAERVSIGGGGAGSPRSSVDGGGGSASRSSSTPRISVEDHSDGARVQVLETISPAADGHPPPYSQTDPLRSGGAEGNASTTPAAAEATGGEEPPADPKQQQDATPADPEEPTTTTTTLSPAPPPSSSSPSTSVLLPPIPDAPPPPQLPDLAGIADKDARKQAEKESRRVQKAYDKAVRDRDRALRERAKLVEKRERRAHKEAEKRLREEQKRRDKEGKDKDKEDRRQKAARRQQQQQVSAAEEEEEEDTATPSSATGSSSMAAVDQPPEGESQATPAGGKPKAAEEKKKKPPKERKFCTLPGKRNGAADETWVPIYMADTDEVGAHCGLFFPGPQYDKLVGDVGSRIVSWVHEDASRRAILELD